MPIICSFIYKFLFNFKLLFDFRGLWADEKIDSGIINLEKKTDKFLYNFIKKIEDISLKKSDSVIFLTKKVERFFNHKFNYTSFVIPCCADFNKFKIYDQNNEGLNKLKSKLNININDFVIGYVGTFSQLYLPHSMFFFVNEFMKNNKNTKFLIITNEKKDEIIKILQKRIYENINENNMIIVSAIPNEIPLYINICNLTLSFVRDTFARMASSPTKIAESIGCGVPVICNKNVGDTNDLFKDNPLLLVNAHSEDSLIKKAIEIKNFSINKYDIRDQFMNKLALEVAKNNYIEAYKNLLN